MAEDGFAVAVYREGGRWDCALLPPAVLDDLDTCVAVLRQQPSDGGPIALVDVADEFFVALRLGSAGVRILLSDITAAEEFTIARQALDRAGGDLDDSPSDPEDDIEVPDSFRVIRPSTGNSDLSDRDFCADLVEFTR